MTAAERKQAFNKARQAELKARAALLEKTREDVIKLLNEALAEIKTLLATMPTEYEMYRLPLLQKQIEQTLTVFQNNSAAVLAQGAVQAWAGGQALVTAPLEAAGIGITSSLPALAQGAASSAPLEAAVVRSDTPPSECLIKYGASCSSVGFGSDTPPSECLIKSSCHAAIFALCSDTPPSECPIK